MIKKRSYPTLHYSHKDYRTKDRVMSKILVLIFTLAGLIFLSFDAESLANELEVGAAKSKITPYYFETWTDLNNNAKKDKDEPYVDQNKNGKYAVGIDFAG